MQVYATPFLESFQDYCNPSFVSHSFSVLFFTCAGLPRHIRIKKTLGRQIENHYAFIIERYGKCEIPGVVKIGQTGLTSFFRCSYLQFVLISFTSKHKNSKFNMQMKEKVKPEAFVCNKRTETHLSSTKPKINCISACMVS